MEKREYSVAECSFCHRTRFIAAKGLCRACYQYYQRNGTLERKPRTRTVCKVDGCDRVVVSHGFCDLHWHRFQMTGDPHKTLRPQDWGKKSKHSLYYSWSYAKLNSGLDERWQKFENFVADVVARPTPTSRLFKLRETEPLGRDNYEWREPLVAQTEGAAYARKHRKANPDYWRDVDLRKNYGITLAQYNAMLELQDGKCAICGDAERVIDKRSGKTRMLAVDHCHKEGSVRKLLCQGCNQGLGNFKDSVALLRKAALYLEGRLGSDGVVLTCIAHPQLTEVDMAKKAKKGKTPMKGSGKQGC